MTNLYISNCQSSDQLHSFPVIFKCDQQHNIWFSVNRTTVAYVNYKYTSVVLSPVVISLIAKIVYFRTTILRWHIHYLFRYTFVLCNTGTMLLQYAVNLELCYAAIISDYLLRRIDSKMAKCTQIVFSHIKNRFICVAI